MLKMKIRLKKDKDEVSREDGQKQELNKELDRMPAPLREICGILSELVNDLAPAGIKEFQIMGGDIFDPKWSSVPDDRIENIILEKVIVDNDQFAEEGQYVDGVTNAYVDTSFGDKERSIQIVTVTGKKVADVAEMYLGIRSYRIAPTHSFNKPNFYLEGKGNFADLNDEALHEITQCYSLVNSEMRQFARSILNHREDEQRSKEEEERLQAEQKAEEDEARIQKEVEARVHKTLTDNAEVNRVITAKKKIKPTTTRRKKK